MGDKDLWINKKCDISVISERLIGAKTPILLSDTLQHVLRYTSTQIDSDTHQPVLKIGAMTQTPSTKSNLHMMSCNIQLGCEWYRIPHVVEILQNEGYHITTHH